MNILNLYNIDDSENLIMKKFEGSQQNILSSVSILNWADKNGFKNYTKINKTCYGKPFIKVDDTKYLLLENIKGKKIKLKDEKQVTSSIKLLGEFHLASEGYIMPIGIKTTANWGRCMEKYKTLTCTLEKYIDILDNKCKKNKFEIETLPYLSDLYKAAKRSIDFFRSEKYINAIEKSMRKREICINDFTQNSLVIEKESKELYLTRMFSLGYNMCEEDIASILKRHIEEVKSIDFLEEIIDEYRKVRNIDKVSKECIEKLALFPETPIKIISKYMRKGIYKDNMLEKFLDSSKVYKNLNMEV